MLKEGEVVESVLVVGRGLSVFKEGDVVESVLVVGRRLEGVQGG